LILFFTSIWIDEGPKICEARVITCFSNSASVWKEPLPDIDFNIRAGNTLVGCATRSQAKVRRIFLQHCGLLLQAGATQAR
jgi:hypothetical protein